MTLLAQNDECQDEALNFCRAECRELCEDCPLDGTAQNGSSLLIVLSISLLGGVFLHTIDATTPAEQESLLHQEICFGLYQSK